MSEYYIECESCGEAYEGSREQINRWLEETEICDSDGENQWVWHCRFSGPIGSPNNTNKCRPNKC